MVSGCLAALMGPASAFAQEMPSARVKAGRPATAARCAAYGTGFLPVAGSDTCIRLSGHVRVEYGWGNPPPRGSDAYGLAVAASPDPGGGRYGRLRPAAPADQQHRR